MPKPVTTTLLAVIYDYPQISGIAEKQKAALLSNKRA
jgi:hypothetical protein